MYFPAIEEVSNVSKAQGSMVRGAALTEEVTSERTGKYNLYGRKSLLGADSRKLMLSFLSDVFQAEK